MRAFGRGNIWLLWVCVARAAPQSSLDFSRRIITEDNVERRDGVLVQRQDQNTVIPAPIVASVSQYWEGNDGPWSSFAIQVGSVNRAQNVRVLPSTASTSTWVVIDQGCPNDAPENCGDNRGGLFDPERSLTWTGNSIFEIGIETNLDYNVNGDFGFDTLTLGWQGSGLPTAEHMVVAGIADTTLSWLGVLGLNPRPTNFSTFPNSPQVSLVQQLRNQNSTPSVSWAYTAGAQYRLNKVFGSLIFGGYDTARFSVPSGTSPNLTFPFYTDISRDLLVGISSIETSNTTSSTSSTKLLDEGINAFIDSTVPHLWLPESVCEKFEDAFGLTWNDTARLYTLNATQHSTLSRLNPSITITLSPMLPPSALDQSVAITLPYSAFNLNVSYPITRTSTYYFPLKRATNETQYTLGRAFLQEAYLIADYERGNFSVWPCSWNSDTNNAKVVPIHSVNETSTNGNGSLAGSGNGNGDEGKKDSSGLSGGTIAGIAVGVAAGIIGAIVAGWLWYRKHHQPKRTSFELDAAATQNIEHYAPAPAYEPHKETPPEELDSAAQHELPSHNKFGLLEAPEGERKYEMEGTDTPTAGVVTEKQDPNAVYEMDASQSGTGPQIYVQPPTAISPGPDAVLPSPLLTPGQIAAAENKRLGHGPEGSTLPSVEEKKE